MLEEVPLSIFQDDSARIHRLKAWLSEHEESFSQMDLPNVLQSNPAWSSCLCCVVFECQLIIIDYIKIFDWNKWDNCWPKLGGKIVLYSRIGKEEEKLSLCQVELQVMLFHPCRYVCLAVWVPYSYHWIFWLKWKVELCVIRITMVVGATMYYGSQFG